MIINVTNKLIILLDEVSEEVARFPTSGQTARVWVQKEPVANSEGLRIIHEVYARILELPDPQPGVIYIAAQLVARAAVQQGRTDVVYPSMLVRDSMGNVIGSRELALP